MDLKQVIRTVPDFPKKGILFRDITPILQNPDALQDSISQLCAQLSDVEFDYVAGPESRGFIFGVPVAYAMHKGFIPIRKPGKLPAKTISKSYDLEYGSNVLEMHADALKPGDRVVVVDDLIATGGTTKAICELVESVGAKVVSLNYVIELSDLKARDLLKGYRLQSLCQFSGE